MRDLFFFFEGQDPKKCVAAVLRGFMLAQSYPILPHEMAFQPFWLSITVEIVASHQKLDTYIFDKTLLFSLFDNHFSLIDF